MTSLKITTLVEKICDTKLDNKIREIYDFRDIMLASLKKSLGNNQNDSVFAFENVVNLHRGVQSKIAPALMDISDKVIDNIRSQIRSYENADRRAN